MSTVDNESSHLDYDYSQLDYDYSHLDYDYDEPLVDSVDNKNKDESLFDYESVNYKADCISIQIDMQQLVIFLEEVDRTMKVTRQIHGTQYFVDSTLLDHIKLKRREIKEKMNHLSKQFDELTENFPNEVLPQPFIFSDIVLDD